MALGHFERTTTGGTPCSYSALVQRRASACACLTALSLGVLGACSPAERVSRPGIDLRDREVSLPAETGLEIQLWIVDDSRGSIGRTLAPVARGPIPISKSLSDRWRAAGLRLVAVPAADLERIRGLLPPAGPSQKQSLGMVPDWTPIVRGTRSLSDRAIRTASGASEPPLTVGPGTLRMLARCWAEPRLVDESGAADGASDIGATLHIEIVPQHEDEGGPAGRIAPELRRSLPAVEQGLLFRRLVAEFEAREGEVYLIVPETPGAIWRTADEASSDAPSGAAGIADGAPSEPGAPTLGEAMLTDAPAAGLARARVIVVIVPRIPRSFELIKPRAGGDESVRPSGAG